MYKKLITAIFLLMCAAFAFANGDYIDPFGVYVFSEGFSGYYESAGGLLAI